MLAWYSPFFGENAEWMIPNAVWIYKFSIFSGIVRKLVVQRNKLLISTGDQKRIMIWDLSLTRKMHLIKSGNYMQSQVNKGTQPTLTLFGCANQNFPETSSAILEPQVTDASVDDQVDAIRLHRNPLCIDTLFVDNFSICIGSPEYPGSVGAILFWWKAKVESVITRPCCSLNWTIFRFPSQPYVYFWVLDVLENKSVSEGLLLSYFKLENHVFERSEWVELIFWSLIWTVYCVIVHICRNFCKYVFVKLRCAST